MLLAWTLLFAEVLDKQAPIKNYRIRRKYQPEWLTSEILDLMKESYKYKLKGNTDTYAALRNKVSAFIDIAKKETYRNKIKEGKSDPRIIWKLLKEFGLKNNDCNNSKLSLKSDDKIITNEADMAGIFNNFFFYQYCFEIKGTNIIIRF